MKRVLLTTIAMMFMTAALLAQNSPSMQMPMPMPSNLETIDGAKTPEKIPDTDAYRLWFVVNARAHSTPVADVEKQRRHFEGKLRIDSTDSRRLFDTLANFKEDYEKLISEYNDSVAKPTGTNADEIAQLRKEFLQKRDALVEMTRRSLSQTLTAGGMTKLHGHIQDEKRHMSLTNEQ